jgi:predicted CXXCH cytochrome family protein
MNKSSAYLLLSALLLGIFLSVPNIQGSHKIINGYSFYDVHVWPDSKCSVCHTSSKPIPGFSQLINEDQSRLCESCHEGTVTIHSSNILMSEVVLMNNHPIKISPLEFDPEKLNHNIIRQGDVFYVSGESGKVPLYGDTKESAVLECGTCHDPHGRQKTQKLHRIDNSKSQLCLACHYDY